MKRILILLLLLCLLPLPSASSFAEDKPVIVIGIVSDSHVEDYKSNYFTKRLEALAGVELEFVVFAATAADQFKSTLNSMLSFNTKLPDILCTETLDDTTVANLGAQGILLPLDEYMNDAEKMPFYHLNVPADVRSMIQYTTQSFDGHVYGLSKYAPWPWNTCPYRMWVNNRWLEKLNLDMPTTLDEFKDVLTHFVNDDPNGNGIKDEIGIMGATNGWGNDVFPFIMNAFVYTNPGNYLVVNNGLVSPAYITDEWKQGLQFMHDLIEEGLLSPWSFMQTQEQLASFVQTPGGEVGFVPSGSYSIFKAGTVLEYDEMALQPPLIGYNGQQYMCYSPTLPDMNWFITKDCHDIEAAIRLGDAFFDEEMCMISRYGEKGVEWDNDPEGCAQYVTRFYETQPETEVTFYTIDTSFWNSVQNKNWFDRNPRYQSLESAMGEGTILIKDIPVPGQPLVQAKDYNPDFFNSYWPHIPKEYCTVHVNTEEGERILATIAPEIISFVRETSIAFITGRRSFDTWDTYLNELNGMGLETYLEIMQTAYDHSQHIDVTNQ